MSNILNMQQNAASLQEQTQTNLLLHLLHKAKNKFYCASISGCIDSLWRDCCEYYIRNHVITQPHCTLDWFWFTRNCVARTSTNRTEAEAPATLRYLYNTACQSEKSPPSNPTFWLYFLSLPNPSARRTTKDHKTAAFRCDAVYCLSLSVSIPRCKLWNHFTMWTYC